MTLALGLASKLRRVSAKHRASELERNELIAEAHEQGGTAREIAEAVGLSHVAVHKIVKRRGGGAAVDGSVSDGKGGSL